MDKRGALIAMINNEPGQEQREEYSPQYSLGGAPTTWEEYETKYLDFGEIDFSLEQWLKPDEEWLLTPSQAAQLGPIRGNKILLQDGYENLLREWGLIK